MAYTNKFEVPLPLAIFLAADHYMYAKEANEISTTTLMRSLRYIMATRRAMYPEQFDPSLHLTQAQSDAFNQDLQELVPSRVGTAIHTGVDNAIIHNYATSLKALGYPDNIIQRILVNPEPEQIKEDSLLIYTEQRSYKEIEGFIISGQFDAVVDGTVHDIKSTGTFSYESGSMDKKYITQGSIYRWLNPELITGNNIVINFLFTNWNKHYALNKPSYPQARALGKSFPLWSLQDTESYIRNKLCLLKEYWDVPLHMIPCCSDEELYSSPPTFKYYKSGYAEGKRSTKNFDNYTDATAYRASQGGVGEIKEERGTPFKCPCCDMGVDNLFNSDLTHTPVTDVLNLEIV